MLLTMSDKSINTACRLISDVSSSHAGSFNTFAEPFDKKQAVSKLWLSHTPAEHQLYELMLAKVTAAKTRVCAFSLRQLMALTRLPNYSAVRRGLNGLISKHNIERYKVVSVLDSPRQVTVYFVLTPEEIFERYTLADRRMVLGEKEMLSNEPQTSIAFDRIVERKDLSRREAQVALCCAEGLTNIEIGKRLHISEQTVKFHLRHIFVKYGVRRRTELILLLLTQFTASSANDELIE